jgi:DNA-binding transcriptional ArsR family regulator
MIRFEFSVEDLARMRFAISPTWELARSLLALRDPATAALHLPWLRRLSGRLGGIDLRPAVALIPPAGYMPDFLTPPPDSPIGDIAADLDRIRRTPPERIRDEMALFGRQHRAAAVARPWLEDPRGMAQGLAGTLEAFWHVALEPHWPRIQALLQADVEHRARRLAEGGPAAVLGGLGDHVRWRADAVEVDMAHDDAIALAGRGLVLVPSAFLWNRPFVITREPWQPTLIYPARGVATLWEEGSRASSEGLAGVLGRTRAALLADLEAPRSTTELARRHGLSPGGASQHLSALRGAGLVVGRRDGRSVLYMRTALGDGLAGHV